jgi:peroxiredoxin
MSRLVSATLIALAPLAGLAAQDPARDLPSHRIAPAPSPEQSIALGFDRLRAGWNWEAARCFREVIAHDADRSLGHLLLALALRDRPNRAVRLCWDATARAEGAPAEERRLVDVYRRYFGVTDQPELTDPRFRSEPPRERAEALIDELAKLPAADGTTGTAARLLAIERARLAPRAGIAAADIEKALQSHHAYLERNGAMPFTIPGYADLLGQTLADAPDREQQLARLPRHPLLGGGAPVGPLPGLDGAGPERWTPRQAPGFDLPRGLGGRVRYDDLRAEPLLVVFFLGFGCAHCQAQLVELEPKAPKVRAAGIDVVTIGTDDANQVLAARQAAYENGIDPVHFEVLCDPAGEVFKRWGVWDEFAGEALHGTFLVDGEGRVLWQDVSVRPFEDSDWLLAECRRLLAAWQ